MVSLCFCALSCCFQIVNVWELGMGGVERPGAGTSTAIPMLEDPGSAWKGGHLGTPYMPQHGLVPRLASPAPRLNTVDLPAPQWSLPTSGGCSKEEVVRRFLQEEARGWAGTVPLWVCRG